MSKYQDEGREQLYVIPTNFIESGRMFNGMVKTRNFIEALIVVVFMFFFLNLFPYKTTGSKIVIMIMLIGPPALICLTGINDEPVSSVLKSIHRWRKNRCVMLYNRKPEAQKMRAVDALMERELPREKLMRMVNQWKKQRAERLEAYDLVEGENFAFAPDLETQHINELAAQRRRAAAAESELIFSQESLDDIDIEVSRTDRFSEEFDDEADK